MDIKIEKDVPIRSTRIEKSCHYEFYQFLDQLEVGDSFTLRTDKDYINMTDENVASATVRGFKETLSRHGKRNGRKYTTHQEISGTASVIRVWRVE